ncbi:membrane coat complex Retromer, subunit VPS5/SNX1 [Moesziomyces antarcticus T-34]|uniref:Membrane coat complex Retromer, subunit VPS5/SNX1 n=1 Tax=Pseudozyma antarctica (strain T-34) TaxID=1151754 RepID=M9LQ85_PSEA3|nr:membrane coat complex Retromer, subunit VPS5/SNX1 [Moesziomyces antarcticus T-34]
MVCAHVLHAEPVGWPALALLLLIALALTPSQSTSLLSPLSRQPVFGSAHAAAALLPKCRRSDHPLLPSPNTTAMSMPESSTRTAPQQHQGIDKPLPGVVPSAAIRPDLDQRKDDLNGRAQDTAPRIYEPHTKPRELFLRVRVQSIERAKKDLVVRIDALTNLPHFRASSYPGVTRSYRELCLYALALSLSSPAIIVPALPLPSTTASGVEDTRILRLMLARWFFRILAEPSLRDHAETRNLIEADFAYAPTPPGTGSSSAARKRFANALASAASVAYGGVDATGGLPNGVLATSASAGSRISSSGFSILGLGTSSKGLSTSRSVYDDDEDLVAARAEVTRLEMQFADAAEASEKLANARRSLNVALSDLSVKLSNLGAVEEIRPPSLRLGLPYVLKRTAYTARSLGELQDALSNTELLTLGDAVAYQSINARAAKETMLARNALVEEHHTAQKATVNKKREAEHLKMQRNLRADRVDDALEELHEAQRHEHALAQHLKRISHELHASLQSHSRHAHHDVQQALIEHARGSTMFAKQMLKEMHALSAELDASRRGEASKVHTPVRPTHTPRQSSVSRPPYASVDSGWSTPTESPAQPRSEVVEPSRPSLGSPRGSGRSESMAPSLSGESNAWSRAPSLDAPSMAQSMHAAAIPPSSPSPSQRAPPVAQSMFLDRPTSARPNPFGTLNSGSSGTASGRSRISAADAARSLAGTF